MRSSSLPVTTRSRLRSVHELEDMASRALQTRNCMDSYSEHWSSQHKTRSAEPHRPPIRWSSQRRLHRRCRRCTRSGRRDRRSHQTVLRLCSRCTRSLRCPAQWWREPLARREATPLTDTASASSASTARSLQSASRVATMRSAWTVQESCWTRRGYVLCVAAQCVKRSRSFACEWLPLPYSQQADGRADGSERLDAL